MAYSGRTPTSGFRSTPTKDTFSGNNSDTQFTLSIPTRTNDVEVFVENIQQEPVVAYSISGTDLTFTSAPPTGTNNIYVIHRGELVETTVHPSTADLNAVNGSFSGDVVIDGDLQVQGTTVSIDNASVQTVDLGDNDRIRLGSANDFELFHNGSNSHISVQNDSLVITANTVLQGNFSVTGESQYMSVANTNLLVNDRMQVANTNLLVNDRMQVANTNLLVNDRLQVANAEALYVSLSGDTMTGDLIVNANVGIGTSSPASALHINNIVPTLTLEDDNNGIGGIAYTPKINFVANGDEVGSIGYSSGNLDITTENINSSSVRVFTGNSERMRVSSNGNVGIGVSDPASKLSVSGNTSLDGATTLRDTLYLQHTGIGISFEPNNLGAVYHPIEGGVAISRYFLQFDYTNNASYPLLTNRTPSGAVKIFSGVSAGGSEIERISVEGGDGTQSVNFKNSNVVVQNGSVTATQYYDSTAGYYLDLGATGTALYVRGDIQMAEDAKKIIYGQSGQAYGGPHGQDFYDDDGTLKWGVYYRTSPETITWETGGSSAKMTLTTAGNLTITGSYSSSDLKLKENLQPIENALAKVTQLQGYQYNFIENPEEQRSGLIAQEAEAAGLNELVRVFTEPSTVDDDEPIKHKTLNYSDLIAYLVECIKELKNENDDLKTRVEALETN